MLPAPSETSSVTLPTKEAKPSDKWKREPAFPELFRMLAVAAVFFAGTLIVFHGWSGRLLSFGDNSAYLGVATAIRHWDFHGLDVQHFMGYPYTIALVSLVLHLPLISSLWLV